MFVTLLLFVHLHFINFAIVLVAVSYISQLLEGDMGLYICSQHGDTLFPSDNGLGVHYSLSGQGIQHSLGGYTIH